MQRHGRDLQSERCRGDWGLRHPAPDCSVPARPGGRIPEHCLFREVLQPRMPPLELHRVLVLECCRVAYPALVACLECCPAECPEWGLAECLECPECPGCPGWVPVACLVLRQQPWRR